MKRIIVRVLVTATVVTGAGCDGTQTGGTWGGGGIGNGNSGVGGFGSGVGGSGSGVGGVSSGVGGSGSSTVATASCQMTMSGGISYCATGPKTTLDCVGDASAGMTAKIVTSCPTGALLTCKVDTGSGVGSLYVYDQATVDAMKELNPTDPCSGISG